ncbi:hypothetical protein E2C01_051850 [Portunus trituberculatus]|uniref:HTH psq-type domain-containing protein n=1 Tax=Portunus trituberculatus TaxID=210409 RepID=A0A5B7GCW4_PORTR|nr:hypothetical protein [Portunus trituberculatus]
MEFIRKLVEEANVTRVCEEYGMTKQVVLDISKSKDKLVEYSAKYCKDASSSKSGRRRNSISPQHNMAEEEYVSLK